jgi:hypothetical protein
MIGAKWQIGIPGQSFLGLCVGDSVIAPEHRRSGLFTRITRIALNDLDKMGYTYVFNLSASPVTLHASLAMGWRSVGDLQTMHWKAGQGANSSRMLSYAAKFSMLFSAKKSNPFHLMDKNSMKRQGKVSPYVFVEQTPQPEAMAELVKRTVSDERIRHVRDKEYFSWRFNNPLSRYRFLSWQDTRMEGYLILQTKSENNRLRVNIVDWEAANLQVQSDLLQAALRLGNFDVLSIRTATLPDAVKMLLKKNGFHLSEAKSIEQYRPTVLVRPVRDDMLNTEWTVEGRRLLDLSNWDLRMIYSDGN